MWAAAIFALAVLGVVLLVWMGQRTLIYFPDRDVPSPAVTGLPGVEAVQIPAADGVTLRAWFLPSRSQPPSPAAIVFNGNAGNRAYRSSLAAALGGLDLSVLLFDYRGFGDSDGSPTERGLYEDARAVRRYLAGRSDVRADRLVYFGESLGTAVAVRLAVEHPPAAIDPALAVHVARGCGPPSLSNPAGAMAPSRSIQLHRRDRERPVAVADRGWRARPHRAARAEPGALRKSAGAP